ncbi:hypothetical protein ACIPJS_14350 [Streptomyces sp. NPDC086783]|uniref:hypothetical protein n=1 Tax=Streptomyces sp. NPDC086783 TaxID=3365758 RepID=UPI00380F27B2
MEVSRRLRVTADTVPARRRRLLDRGLGGLSDEPRPGVRGRSPTRTSNGGRPQIARAPPSTGRSTP